MFIISYFEDVTDRAGVNMDSLKRGNALAAGTFTFCSSMTVCVAGEIRWSDIHMCVDLYEGF